MTTPIATPETIAAAVAAQLQNISVANGYKTDVSRVYRVPMVDDQVTEANLPALTVVTPPNAHGFSAMNDKSYRATLRLIVGGMIAKGQADMTDSDRVTALNYLFEDTLDALLEDPRFGFQTGVDSVLEAADDVIDMDSGRGLFALALHVTYHFTRGTL